MLLPKYLILLDVICDVYRFILNAQKVINSYENILITVSVKRELQIEFTHCTNNSNDIRHLQEFY